MDLLKKLSLTILIILFMISIFKDLTVGTIVQSTQPVEESNNDIETEPDTEQPEESKEQEVENERFRTQSYTTVPGDTVLSIVERMNINQSSSIQVNQIIEDFITLNPGIDPHKIIPNTEYLFPVYK